MTTKNLNHYTECPKITLAMLKCTFRRSNEHNLSKKVKQKVFCFGVAAIQSLAQK